MEGEKKFEGSIPIFSSLFFFFFFEGEEALRGTLNNMDKEVHGTVFGGVLVVLLVYVFVLPYQLK